MTKLDLTVLYQVSYGMYIIGATSGELLNGQIANTVFQIASEPPTLAVSINKQNLTHQYIVDSNAFSVNVLETETPMSLIARFGFKSGRDGSKFTGVNHRLGATGCPIVLEHVLGFMEVKVLSQTDCGTHTLFVGELVAGEHLQAGEPMTYAYYHQVKRGTAPSTAPTFIKQSIVEKGELTMEKYKCQVCGYVYDPKDGDPDSGVKPGTSFDQIPEDWVCPICGADKAAFEKE